MDNVSENEKNTLEQKLLEFQKLGLVAYGKFLKEQHDFASNDNSKIAYKKYIEQQIELNTKKIAEIDEKLA